MAAHVPATRLVYVADREADLVPLMLRAQELVAPVNWLVRAKHNRCLPDGDRLWEHTGAVAYGAPATVGAYGDPAGGQWQEAGILLKPLYEAMRQALLCNAFLHGDETTVQVLNEAGRKAQTTSYMWV